MATNAFTSKKPACGLMVLGNAGSGKSFICNLLLGKERFESDFQSEAVTTVTEHERLDMGQWELLVYNIPGLVEVNQEQIDRNKREIMRAFDECPKSIVIFVWTQIGGRAQYNDIIAFRALHAAYQFAPESLAFIVNNLPPDRPSEYEGQILITLANALKPFPVSVKDTIFIDNIDLADKEKLEKTRLKLIYLLSERQATDHYKQHDIVLQADQLKEAREALKRKQLEAESDKATYQQQILEMGSRFEKELQDTNRRQEEALRTIEIEQQKAKLDREKYERCFEQMMKERERKGQRSNGALMCDGEVCSDCRKCRTKGCSGNSEALGATVGAIVSALSAVTGPLGLIVSALGRGVGAWIGYHPKCDCK